MRARSLDHRFVSEFPATLETGVLYISVEFGTVSHLCCCGCGHEVVTPLHPTDWKMIYDGASVSLEPSIGNWGLKCRSHYIIRCGKVVWAGDWSIARIAGERFYDEVIKREWNSEVPGMEPTRADTPSASEVSSLISRVLRWCRK